METSYRKISDATYVIENTHTPKEILELPVSFIICPVCDNHRLTSCGCRIKNYNCPKCGWKHSNHHHNTKQYGANLTNQGMLDKIGRK